MPLVNTADLVGDARRANTGVAAFNVITLEHAEAIVAGAERAGRPVILQISHNAIRFHDDRLTPIALAARAVADASAIDVSLHLDHIEDAETLANAVPYCSSAMFDAGNLTYAENVVATRTAVDWAHSNGLWLEAELGYVGGKDNAPQSAHAPGVRTDPDEAAAFVDETGVDSLAVAVGSSHAMTQRSADLDLDLIAALRDRLGVPLVLHGSSGVPDDTLAAAVEAGMTKINIGTALNVAYTDAVRRALDADAELVDPRRYISAARERVAATVAHFLGVVDGSAR